MNSSHGNEELKPIFEFYFDFDDLPILAEKSFWNERKFHEHRQPFYDNFERLVKLVDELLEKCNR